MQSKLHWLSILGLGLYSPLDKKTVDFIESHMVLERYKKGQIIHKPGKTFDKICFIRSGLVKGYYKLDNYSLVNWISCENEVFTSSKYFSHKEGTEYIEAIESTTVDYLCFADINKASKLFRAFRDLRLKLLEEYYCYAEERAMIARIPLAKDRIKYLKNRYPKQYLDRIPSKDLASFLGIKPETYSRLNRVF